MCEEIDFINEELTSFSASGCCNHHPGVDPLEIVIIIQAFIISTNSEAIKDNLREGEQEEVTVNNVKSFLFCQNGTWTEILSLKVKNFSIFVSRRAE